MFAINASHKSFMFSCLNNIDISVSPPNVAGNVRMLTRGGTTTFELDASRSTDEIGIKSYTWEMIQ